MMEMHAMDWKRAILQPEIVCRVSRCHPVMTETHAMDWKHATLQPEIVCQVSRCCPVMMETPAMELRRAIHQQATVCPEHRQPKSAMTALIMIAMEIQTKIVALLPVLPVMTGLIARKTMLKTATATAQAPVKIAMMVMIAPQMNVLLAIA